MTTLDRRNFLRTAAYGAGLGLIPASIQKAMALPAISNKGTIEDVQHVVILMQENRSFDHYFGTLPGVRGFGDRFTIPQPAGASVFAQQNDTRSVLSYYLDSTKGKALGVGTPHSWGDAQAAWDHGRISHWPVSKTDVSMGYLKTADLPFHTALANAFTVCDHYHCAEHGGTNTNRTFHWTGTNRGTTARSDGLDMCVINNDGWDTCSGTPLANSLTWKTYPERLEAAGVSWKIYQQLPDNYTDNPLSGFLSYRNAYGKINKGNLDSYSDVSAGPSMPYLPTMDMVGSPNYEPLYKGIGNTETDYGNYLALFTADALADTLPAVSWIVGPAMYTEHPDYTPAQGAYFIQRILDALTANPTVWGKTVFFVNYDENDGYFDHMPPPVAPSPLAGGGVAGKSTVDTHADYFNVPNATNLEAGDGRPFGPGPRVPMFVVSPFSRGGFVDSQQFDHTSVLRFLEQRFGVAETNISPWRRAMLGDLMSAFDFANPNAETTSLATSLPRQNIATAYAQYAQQSTASNVEPPAEDAQALPVQVPGTRPARPLPYALDVVADATAGTGSVSLSFVNSGTAGAVFHVYDRLNIKRIPRRYGVEAKKQLRDDWAANAPAQEYDLWVLAPNGFHRLLRGSASTAGLEVLTRFDAAANLMFLTLVNDSARTVAFTLTAPAYRTDGPMSYSLPAASREELSFSLVDSKGWHDFTVRAPGGFTRRVAGHLETGVASISDPAMAAPEVAAPLLYADQLDAAPGTLVESKPMALSGFPGYLPVRVSDGSEFSIDGGRFVSSAPNVCTGQTLTLRHRAASGLLMPMISTLTVGTTESTFKSVTAASATPPSPGSTSSASPVPDIASAPLAAGSSAGTGRFGGALGGLSLAPLVAAFGLKKTLDKMRDAEGSPDD